MMGTPSMMILLLGLALPQRALTIRPEMVRLVQQVRENRPVELVERSASAPSHDLPAAAGSAPGLSPEAEGAVPDSLVETIEKKSSLLAARAQSTWLAVRRSFGQAVEGALAAPAAATPLAEPTDEFSAEAARVTSQRSALAPLQNRMGFEALVTRLLAERIDQASELMNATGLAATQGSICEEDGSGKRMGCKGGCSCRGWESCYTDSRTSSDEGPLGDRGVCGMSMMLQACGVCVFLALLVMAIVACHMSLRERDAAQAHAASVSKLNSRLTTSGMYLDKIAQKRASLKSLSGGAVTFPSARASQKCT